jgi:predicted HNH restriction endonuclease
MNIVSRDQILAKLAEFDEIGDAAFFEKYPKNADSKTTWLIYNNKPYPVKSIFYSAEIPYTGSGNRVTHDARNKLRKLEFHVIEEIEKIKLTEYVKSLANSHLVIDDLHSEDFVNDDPEYRKRMAGSYVRDTRVREQVLKRAAGFCEECGQHGFQTRGGKPYLETHHVIALSEQGPDRPHNVIALCATDHRRAHYAENWKELQDKFLAQLSKYKTEI